MALLIFLKIVLNKLWDVLYIHPKKICCWDHVGMRIYGFIINVGIVMYGTTTGSPTIRVPTTLGTVQHAKANYFLDIGKGGIMIKS